MKERKRRAEKLEETGEEGKMKERKRRVEKLEETGEAK